MSGVRSLVGLEIRRNPPSQQITEARGLAASLRRDAIFRRFLLAADIIAIAGAFLLVTRLSPRPLQRRVRRGIPAPRLRRGARTTVGWGLSTKPGHGRGDPMRRSAKRRCARKSRTHVCSPRVIRDVEDCLVHGARLDGSVLILVRNKLLFLAGLCTRRGRTF
jgi:hypothetical protein